jgi:preprotein translocase subunit SecG
MYVFITILIIIICVLLGLIVLIQNPKGGGVNATFGGASQQIFGASRTTDVIEKTTWTLAVLLLVFCLCSAFFIDKKTVASKKSAAGEQTKVAAPVEVDEVSKRLKETNNASPIATPPAPQGQQQGQQPQTPKK